MDLLPRKTTVSTNVEQQTKKLAIIQQFRADFRMPSDTLMDTFTLVRNRLEKQDTRFCEAFLIEKRVEIAFRSSR